MAVNANVCPGPPPKCPCITEHHVKVTDKATKEKLDSPAFTDNVDIVAVTEPDF